MEPTSATQYLNSINNSSFYVVLVVVSILGVYSSLLHFFLYYYRTHPLIQSASPLFGQLIVAGSWFVYAAVLIMKFKATSGVCSMIPIFLCMAFVMMIGTLFAKTWRLNRIFHGASLKSVRVTSGDVFKFIGIFFAFDFLVNLIWETVDKPRPDLESDATNLSAMNTYCSSDYYTAWYILLIVPKGLLLLYGAYLAYNIRHISASFNESRFIGLTILHGIIFSLIIIPLDLGLHDQLNAHYLIITLLLCLCTFITLTLLFMPKFYTIFVKKKKNVRDIEDSESNKNNNNQNDIIANARWNGHFDSDSKQLSFPSLAGGFTDAVKLVRVIAESLYKDQGANEYWQFCLAMRTMSQREIEVRGPVIEKIHQQQMLMAKTKNLLIGGNENNKENHFHTNQIINTQENKNLSVIISDISPLSQPLEILDSEILIDVTTDNSSHPLTQTSFARANSSIISQQQQQQQPIDNNHNKEIELIENSHDKPIQTEFELMPEFPSDAWQLLTDELENIVNQSQITNISNHNNHNNNRHHHDDNNVSLSKYPQSQQSTITANTNSALSFNSNESFISPSMSNSMKSQSNYYHSQASSTLEIPLNPVAFPTSPASTLSTASLPSESQSPVGHLSQSSRNDSDHQNHRNDRKGLNGYSIQSTSTPSSTSYQINDSNNEMNGSVAMSRATTIRHRTH